MSRKYTHISFLNGARGRHHFTSLSEFDIFYKITPNQQLSRHKVAEILRYPTQTAPSFAPSTDYLGNPNIASPFALGRSLSTCQKR